MFHCAGRILIRNAHLPDRLSEVRGRDGLNLLEMKRPGFQERLSMANSLRLPRSGPRMEQNRDQIEFVYGRFATQGQCATDLRSHPENNYPNFTRIALLPRGKLL